MRTILIVDDDEFLRETIRDTLKQEGYVVIEADGARTALDLLQERRVDLIISDIQMPGGDGFELLRELHLQYPTPPPLIFVSGHPDITESEVVALGAAQFFEKPFVSSELLCAVRFLLGAS